MTTLSPFLAWPKKWSLQCSILDTLNICGRELLPRDVHVCRVRDKCTFFICISVVYHLYVVPVVLDIIFTCFGVCVGLVIVGRFLIYPTFQLRLFHLGRTARPWFSTDSYESPPGFYRFYKVVRLYFVIGVRVRGGRGGCRARRDQLLRKIRREGLRTPFFPAPSLIPVVGLPPLDPGRACAVEPRLLLVPAYPSTSKHAASGIGLVVAGAIPPSARMPPRSVTRQRAIRRSIRRPSNGVFQHARMSRCWKQSPV